MKTKLICTLLLIMVLCTGLLFASGKQEKPEEPGTGAAKTEPASDSAADAASYEDEPAWLIENSSDYITIIDAAGREVTIQKPVKRIVQNHPAPAEALNIVGAWDLVVGGMTKLGSPELFPGIEGISDFITSGNPFDINYEMVYELDPDLFVTMQSPVPGYDDVVDKLEPAIPVVALVNTADPESFDTSIRMLGAILDQQAAAEEYISWSNKIKNQINEKIDTLPEADLPRVFLKSPGWTIDQLSTLTEEMLFSKVLFEGAGGKNIADGMPSTGGWVQNVDPEWLVEQDYDIIVVQLWNGLYPYALGYSINDASAIQDIREEIMTSELFSESGAVKNNRVYLYHSDFGSTHRIIIGMAYWAKWFHPELFKDFDPQEIHQEYLKKFMNVDLDLSSGGVIVYPEK